MTGANLRRVTNSRLKWTCCVLATGLGSILSSSVSHAQQKWPASVHALYDIRFNGLKVGAFEFRSQANHTGYALESTGKVSVLLGAMKWNGDAKAHGALANAEIQPADFNFNLKGPVKGGTTQMTFAGGSVASVVMVPPAKVRPDTIPVDPKLLQGVLDPFAAVMALTKGGPNPCSRTIPVYDGKRRLDLVLSSHGQVPLGNAKPSDIPTIGLVCRLTYKLIAGHRPGDETAYMNRNQNIEMVLRPVPSANIYVPYQITAATLLGHIVIFAKHVTISGPGLQELVLNH